MTGFGAFAAGGLAWWEGDDVVALDGLGDVFSSTTLNPLLALGPPGWDEALAAARAHDGPRTSLAEARMRLPFEVADYIDFYSSLDHASNMGRILRPGQEPLRPNWRWLPVGYHGRAGTVVVSGTDVVRPNGECEVEGDPVYGPTDRLDVELELGFVVGVPSRPGEGVGVEGFAEHVFGVVLVNDWSARDIQAWEYVPLGPFLRQVVPDVDLGLGDPAFAARAEAGRGATRRNRRRSSTSPAGVTGLSTSSLRSSSTARSSRAGMLASSTGRCRSSSRTRPRTVLPSATAT